MENKTAIVTGGSSGIGLAICQRLIDRGIEVYSISRNPCRDQDTKYLHPVQLDLSDLDAVASFLYSFVKEKGTPDLLVNNAGYGAFYEWKEFPEDEIIRQCTVLFTAPVLFCKAFAPLMAKSSKGQIVNVTSLATLFPLPYMPLYNAGKSGLSSFTQSLMLEYPKCPRLIDFRLGDIRTSFNRSAPKQSDTEQSPSMKRAWKKIENQLEDSPLPQVASHQMMSILQKDKSGVFYGGGWFQARLSPLISRILPTSLVKLALKFRYGLP